MHDMQPYAEEIDADFECAEVEHVRQSTGELQIRLEMDNGEWGLPGELARYFRQNDLHIVDFSGVSTDAITLYVTRE